jgi:hypothetical protein
MGLKNVLIGVGGAVLAISGVTAVVLHSGGGDATPKRPAASANSSVATTAVAPVAGATTPAANPVPGAVTSPSTVPPASPANQASQATPAVPVPTSGGASVAASVPSAQEVIDSVTALMNQLKQSASNNGVPQSVSKEEVDKAIADQLAKLGIKS